MENLIIILINIDWINNILFPILILVIALIGFLVSHSYETHKSDECSEDSVYLVIKSSYSMTVDNRVVPPNEYLMYVTLDEKEAEDIKDKLFKGRVRVRDKFRVEEIKLNTKYVRKSYQ